jgi:chromosome partitioning protein
LPLLRRSLDAFADENPDATVPEVGGIIFNDTADKVEQAKSRRDVQMFAKTAGWPIFKHEIRHSDSYPAGACQGKPLFFTDNAREAKKEELGQVGDEFLKGIGL